MKSVIVSFLCLLSTAYPQGLNNLSIFKSLNHSIYGLRLALSTSPSAPKHIAGSGTSTDPYILYDAQDVDSIRYIGLNNKYYELGNDIDLTPIPEFIPIPYSNNAGVFSFDGKGHTLSGLKQTNGVYSSTSGAYSLGMFMGKGIGDIFVKNLVIDGFKIHISSNSGLTGSSFAGSILLSVITQSKAQLSNITIRNSSIKFTGDPVSYPAQSYQGLLVGSYIPSGTSLTFIKNCTVEYDTIYFSWGATPNSGHFIGGLVGNLGCNNSGAIFELNASRYNYFYSRVGYTIRTNVGGGLLGKLESSSYLIRFNYSHSNKSDFGNGGAPNNFPWGFGGIFGYTITSNIHTFVQNYAANNECLGANQSGGFYSEDASYLTAQEIDSTLNFCDITSFTEPNTVYGSFYLPASQYPSAKTSAQLKDINTFIGWDFTNTWAIDSTKNNGYPYLK